MSLYARAGVGMNTIIQYTQTETREMEIEKPWPTNKAVEPDLINKGSPLFALSRHKPLSTQSKQFEEMPWGFFLCPVGENESIPVRVQRNLSWGSLSL